MTVFENFLLGFWGGLFYAFLGVGKALKGGEAFNPKKMSTTVLIAGLVGGVEAVTGLPKTEAEYFVYGTGFTVVVDYLWKIYRKKKETAK